jgi:hypothetical protein
MMIFDGTRNRLHNAIIGDKQVTTGAAYPALIEFIDAVADLYVVLSKYWETLSENT